MKAFIKRTHNSLFAYSFKGSIFINSNFVNLRFGRIRRRLKSAGGTTLPIIPADQVPPPPSTSPAFGPTPSAHEMTSQDAAGTEGEYEPFLKGRRPDSSAPSDTTSYQRREQLEVLGILVHLHLSGNALRKHPQQGGSNKYPQSVF